MSFAGAAFNGGAEVAQYTVEWDTNAGVREQQIVTSSSTGGEGTFRLSLGGRQTAPIPHNAQPAELKAALEALPSVGVVAVSRTGTSGGFSWVVTFLTNVGNVDKMRADPSGLVGPNARVDVVEAVAGTAPPFDAGTVGITRLPLGSATLERSRPVQRVRVSTRGADDLNGVFRLAFLGEQTRDISHDASAADVKAALEDHTSIGSVTVSRLRGRARVRRSSLTTRAA